MSASPDDDLTAAAKARVGTTLRQKWRLDRLLGVGGMAAVYGATHRNGNRAAVKVLHADLALVDEIKTRFLREAYVANKVQHRGSVRVLDDDTDVDGTTFLVMDLLEGETLAQRLERRGKRLFAAEVCKIADEILDVLAAAHAKSIIHRDVKPDNVFITTKNETKLLDFGFARVMDAAQQASSLTGKRTTLGTPAFMPPEQAAGRWADLDPRSDLWALGATMFHALSGQYVHEGETLADVLVAAATQPARSLRVVAPHLPPAVVAVVERALAFDKPMRWPDARAMQTATRDAAKTAPGPSKPAVDEPVPSSERTIVAVDPPTIPGPRRAEPPAVVAPPRPAPPRPPSTAPRPAPPVPPVRPRMPSSPARPTPPAPTRDDEDTVSETLLAVMVDTSGASPPGVPRISDPGPSSVPAPPDSVPLSSRVVVETTPYETPVEVLPPEPTGVLEDGSSVPEAKLPRGFRPPSTSSPFWGQSASGVNPAPTADQLGLPPMRSQQVTLPAIGGRAQRDERTSNRPRLIIAGAAGFLFILFAGMLAFLFLR